VSSCRTLWSSGAPSHPRFTRRAALEAGAIGLLGLGMNHLGALHALAAAARERPRSLSGGERGSQTGIAPKAASVIYIFLSGGLSQLESFDLKPDAPAEIRGEFRPIETKTPGIEICEHLPLLAQRSHLWSLVRSLTHSSNDHSAGHHIMLTGRSDLPSGFDPNRPQPVDWPSIAAVAGALSDPGHNLPPAVVLPERLIHNTGRMIPGQFAGLLGASRDPWFIEASPFDPNAYGAYPTFEFDHQERPKKPGTKRFQAPSLTLPEGFSLDRLSGRFSLLKCIEAQRRTLDVQATDASFDDHREEAISLLTDCKVTAAFDVQNADPRLLDRYGRNAFGWSLLMARRLVEAGVSLVQVNLGNNETWDTHGNMFPHLKEKLFPPTDQALSALLDDLCATGLLDSTLVVMAGEFGRTPRISSLPQYYKLPGRDHWGKVQTVWLAGGGVRGGRVVGASDRTGGFPRSAPQSPENMAATIYQALGLPRTVAWHDVVGRPHFVYRGEPIPGLT
jgi:Protein of unknown function (DUF1501)